MAHKLFLQPKVSNELEAYLLGFIFADGYIPQPQCGKSRALIITLAAKDLKHLENIQKWVGAGNIKEKISKHGDKVYPSAQYSYYNTEFAETLKKIGISCRKSYINNSSIYDNLEEKFKASFIRGYFDGDGSVSIGEGKLTVSFVSLNRALLESISKDLNKKIADDKSGGFHLSKDGKYFRLRCGSPRLNMDFAKIIYGKSDFFLDRKRKIFLTYKVRQNKTSKYIGVSKRNNCDKWCATISLEKRKYIGDFDTELEAAKAYNEQAIKFNKKINTL